MKKLQKMNKAKRMFGKAHCNKGEYGLALLIACMLYVSCMPENIELPHNVYSVATGYAIDVTSSTAKLAGNVKLADPESNVSCGIIYGKSSTLSSTSGIKKSTTSSSNYSLNIAGLDANTTYYYRAFAVDAGVYKYGKVNSFTTSKPNITVATGDASDITESEAVLYGTVSGALQSVTCGMIYGTSSTLSSSNGVKKSTTSKDSYSINISGLNANTKYYYRAYAIVDGEYKYGVVRSFNTKQKVSVETGSATDITDSSATLSGTISGSSQSLTCGIIYGTSSTLSSTSGTKKSTTSSGSYSVSINGLDSNTKYYYRAYVVVDGEYKYGDVRSFNTKLNSASISVTTGEATDITDSGATVSGAISGADQSLTCGIIYGTSSTLSSSSGTKKSTTSWSNYSLTLTGLKATTTYYYRAYAVIEGEYVYGEVRMFKTKETIAITTGTATDITESGATISGAISGNSQSLNCGIIYGTSSTLSSTSGTAKSTTSSGNFSISITGLKDNTTYYYRAYVVVDDKYVYGEVRSFKTLQRVTITTGAVTDITANGATLSGMVNGATHSYVCGIIYDTSSTLSSTSGTKHTASSDGDYSFKVSGLKANTTYYYRAYIIVDDEYSYGEVRSFKTKQYISVTTGNATDITTRGATLSGLISGASESLDCGIIYGISSTLSATNGTITSTTSNSSYSINVTNLNSNMTYYYRAYVVVNNEYRYGEVRSFRTKHDVSVFTGDAINVTESSAALNGIVNGTCLTSGIIYGTTSTLSYENGTLVSSSSVSSDGSYSVSVTGLGINTTYYYRAFALVSGGEYVYGEVRSFRTNFTSVDLGLSVNWAPCNVGGKSPEDYGRYYAWGETEEKSNYTLSTYKYWSDKDGDGNVEEKELTNIGSDISGTSYDVAHVKWGGSWRMPTLDEIKELCNKCSWEWTEVNGIKGQKVTGPNGNSIFLPAAGRRDGTEVSFRGSYGYYWSGTLSEGYSYNAYGLTFYSGNHNWSSNSRGYGLPVRPVTDK